MLYTLLTWTGVCAAIIAILIAIARRRALVIQERSIQIGLSSSPNHATTTEIVLLALKAASKHALSLVGCVTAMRPSPGSAQEFKLPYIYMQGLLDFDGKDERLFNDAVRSNSSDEKISPMFLISLTLPLLIHIFADRACPILPLGAVNTRNVFKIHQPQLAHDIDALRNASKASRLSYRAQFGGSDRPGRRRKRGVEFCVSVIILLDNDPILTQELSVLQLLPKSFEPRYIPVDQEQDQTSLSNYTKSPEAHEIHLGLRDPHEWAAATKDYNPIHVSALGAKLFGFKSTIAHGNHLVALAMEALRDEDTKNQGTSCSMARRIWWEETQPVTLEARFVRPTTLPADTRITWQASASEAEYNAWSRGKVCVSGSLRTGNA